MFKKLITNVYAYIRKLQNSDEGTKKRWLVGGSTVAMVVLVASWALYLNVSLPQLSTAGSVEGIEIEKEATNNEPVSEVLVRGIEEILEKGKNAWASIEGAINKGREFEIRK